MKLIDRLRCPPDYSCWDYKNLVTKDDHAGFLLYECDKYPNTPNPNYEDGVQNDNGENYCSDYTERR